MNGSAHGTRYMVGKPQIRPEFRRRQRCLSGLKNRDVTGIAHDVWGTGIISKG